jgi:hypothetical protein
MTATFSQLIEGAAFQTGVITAVIALPATVAFFARKKSPQMHAHLLFPLALFVVLLFAELIPVLYALDLHFEHQVAEMRAQMQAEMAKAQAAAKHGGVGIHIDPSTPNADKYKIITSPGVGNGDDTPSAPAAAKPTP